jgi:hypothetical protein
MGKTDRIIITWLAALTVYAIVKPGRRGPRGFEGQAGIQGPPGPMGMSGDSHYWNALR